jgi:hypothetical protein
MSIGDFQELWTRLCENDVEYNEMKHMCKSNELGGKDMKYKLRAKLIKQVRERLGKQQWTRESYGNHFKYPNKMTEKELAAFFEDREIVMPEQPEEAVGFAFAIMVQDGAIDSSKVPTPSDYDNKNTDDLKRFCKERGLPQSGNKGELMTRLIQHDQEMERQRRGIVARSAAVLEKRLATIDVPPMPPNSSLAAKLEDAVYTASVIGNMTLPELRSTAYGRGLPVYGTVEALQDRIMEVLRREAVEAHAGKDRLLRYAEAGVQKLNENEVLEALALRGIGRKTLGGPEEEGIRLINTLVDEWIHNALQPPPKNLDTGADEDIEEEESEGLLLDDENIDDNTVDTTNEGAEDEEETAAMAVSGSSSGFASYEEDPTLDIFLICSGATQSQRESSLAAARAIVPHLQSDVLWGTLNPATEQEPLYMDDGHIGSPSEPPTDTVEIFCLEPLAHGVLMRLDCPLVAAGTSIIVTAVPVDGEESFAASVVKESRAGDVVVLQGLSPGTGYEFTARLHNAAGDGPEGEPYLAATPQRQGVAVHVLYAVPAENPFNGSGQDGENTYVLLNWEHLHASNAEEIDIQLRASGGAGTKTLSELAPAGSVVLPLGPPSSSASNSSEDQAVYVGSWANPNIHRLITSRPAFAAAARDLGFDAVDLLELSFEEIETSEGKITAWLQAQGMDPLISRVAVRLEAGGTVVAAGIGRGVGEVLQGAANMMEMHNAPRAVLEVVPPAAVFFSCGVVAGPQGVVALPPTEISYDDLEEDFFATDLELEKFLAVTEGEDEEKVTALVAMEKESRRLPPGALGSMPLPSQRAVHTTPPVSLPPGVAENIRLASAKLFSELGIQDFAQFSGWVVPDDALQEAGLAPAAELLRLAEEAGKNGNGTSVEQDTTPKTFAELAALHEQEQARLTEEAHTFATASSSNSANGVSQADKSAAVDIQDYALAADEEEEEAAFANLPVLREAGEGVLSAPVQYGMFAGMMLDNRTREDLLQDNPPPPAEKIPLGPPEVVAPDALPALGELQASELCRSIPGRRITFSQVDTSLVEVGNRLGVLAQQSAAVGLSLSTLPRQLVSLAAARAGLPALARVPVGPPEDYYMDEDDIDFNASVSSGFEGFLGGGDSSADEQQQTSFDDIGSALDRFEWERSQPPPAEDDESYDAIRNAAEAEEAAAAAEAAALAAAEASGQLSDIGEGDVNGLGGMAGSAYPPFYDDFFAAEDSVVDLRRQFPGLHPTRQRVWVLCGGEGPQRDDSLRAAVHAASVLQNEQDLLVETFFLDPYDAGVGEGDRRRTLLSRRLDLLKIGADDDNLLEDCPEFHPSRIRHPTPPNPEDLSWRGVWRLGSSPVVKTNVPDLKVGCETALNKGTTAWINRRSEDAIHRQETLLAATKKELELAGLTAGGPAPWGGYLDRTNLPEYSFLKDWVAAAQEQCVVVLLALPGHPIAQGALQRLLESRQVPFTGPSSIGAELCADRPELLRMLGNEPPFHSLSLPELAAKCESEASADDFHSRLFGGWEGKILSIRPAHSCGGLGVMRAANGRDLQLYYAAVQEWADVIPAELIAGEDEDIQMPVPPSTQFIIEPASKSVWLTLKTDKIEEEEARKSSVEKLSSSSPTAAVHAAIDALASRLTWPPKDPKDRWLEVKACLLGSSGNMRTLSLTATVLQTRYNETTGEEESIGSFELTPIPTTILSPEKALEAKLRLQQIADTAGLSGAAAITALVDTSSGDVCEVIIREVDSHPDLTPEGLLMRQAAAAPSPLSPTEVLRELLKVGMSREGGMDVGELSWLSGNDLYDLNDGLLPSGSASSGRENDLGGAGSGLTGLGSAGGSFDSSNSRGQYWGDPDVEIEPEFLGLSAGAIWEEIRNSGDSSSSEEEASGASGSDVAGNDPCGFMMD